MKNSIDFQAFAPRTPKMRLFFTPKTLALASGLALALAMWPAQAGAQPAAGLSKAISVEGIAFQPVRGQNPDNSWMVALVELTAKSNPDAQALNPKWVPDVSVTLTLGWGENKTPPQLDLAVSATAKLVALQVNGKAMVMFFVPPEFLQSGSKNPAGLNANSKPTFYVVQVTAAGTAIDLGKQAVSSSLPSQNYIDGFLRASGDQTTKNAGMMLTTQSVPAYILTTAISQYANGATIPTLKSAAMAGM